MQRSNGPEAMSPLYVKNYGALAGVVVLLLWQFLTALSILVGAQLNGELERQRAMTAAEDERS